MSNLWPRSRRQGLFSLDFTADSTDQGFRFNVSAEGQWRNTSRHHNPAAAASCHVIDEVAQLAATCSILAPAELQNRANARLGQSVPLTERGIRLNWAIVHVHVTAEDMDTARNQTRLRARIRMERELEQLQMTQALVYRDHLREDPTLVLAQMLLTSPETVSDQTIDIIPKLAEQVAAHAPGAAWVQTARLLDKWFGGMAPDAKRFIIDRMCTVAAEFGGERIAQQLQDVHQATSPDTPQHQPNGDPLTAPPAHH
ncbi:hypothetical protein AB0D11_41615 [Streptomyces monashensis]|uniref:hypothetical protein n=1 Tax=Streptomyces monashensis TaxID=1678012 RepID=UPI0033DB3EEA